MHLYPTLLRAVSCFFLLFFLLTLFSCGGLPNMQELLAYQKDNASFTATVTEGEASVRIRVSLGETDRLTLLDGMADGVTFARTGNELTLQYGDTSLLLSVPDTARADRWLSLFRLSDGARWKIRKSQFGGNLIFVCQSADVTLYIDAVTKSPLRIEADETVIDLIAGVLP